MVLGQRNAGQPWRLPARRGYNLKTEIVGKVDHLMFSIFQFIKQDGSDRPRSDTKCEKIPFDVCGRGCVIKEGEEECFDREVASTVQEPEETCDLHPLKTCKENGKNKLSINN